MRIKQAEAIMNLIQVKYGVKKFMDQGGAVMYLPNPIDIIYLVGGEKLDEDLKKSILLIDKDVEFLPEPNFDGVYIDEIQEEILTYLRDNLVNNFESISINKVANVAVFSGVNEEDENIKGFINLLKSLRGHSRTHIIFMDTTSDKKHMLIEGTTKGTFIAQPSSNREAVIGKDDLINLQITLETAYDVNDFINSI